MASPNLPPLSDDKRRELEATLEQLTKGYQDDLEALADAASSAIEYEHGRPDPDLTGIMRDYARDASQYANNYYANVRKAYEDAYGYTFEDYATGDVYDPDHTLYRMVGGFNGTDYNGLNYTQLKNGQSRAGLTVDDLWPSLKNVDDAMQWAADMVHASARYTMEYNLSHDPTGPRWARVTGGAKPCAFCVMLAGRGFVYHSKETANLGGSFHDGHCHCTAIPGWKDDVLTPSQRESKAMYEAGKAAAGEDAPRNAELAAMRRIYPDKLSDGVTPTPNIRWSHKPIPPTADELERLSDMSITKPGDRYTPARKKDALVHWSGDDYTQINGHLFGFLDETPEIRSWIDRIDEAMHDHETRRVFTVDRLMRIDFFKINSVDDLVNVKRGDIFPHAGYAAGTTNIGGVAAGDGDRIATRILVPPGSHGVYLEPFTQHPGENEVLLPRDMKFMVDGLGTLPDGSPLVYLRMV